MKKLYSDADIEIVDLRMVDVITTSGVIVDDTPGSNADHSADGNMGW